MVSYRSMAVCWLAVGCILPELWLFAGELVLQYVHIQRVLLCHIPTITIMPSKLITFTPFAYRL